jgi:hypothetical protein
MSAVTKSKSKIKDEFFALYAQLDDTGKDEILAYAREIDRDKRRAALVELLLKLEKKSPKLFAAEVARIERMAARNDRVAARVKAARA